jgi:hypothetical protein
MVGEKESSMVVDLDVVTVNVVVAAIHTMLLAAEKLELSRLFDDPIQFST